MVPKLAFLVLRLSILFGCLFDCNFTSASGSTARALGVASGLDHSTLTSRARGPAQARAHAHEELDVPTEVDSISPGPSADPLTIRLPYATYKGFFNRTSSLNTWLGVRYARAPLGGSRWREALEPEPEPSVSAMVGDGPQSEDGLGMIEANQMPAQCPQSTTASNVNVSEDCLFLNVYAPSVVGEEKLPVLVWIHGGSWDHNSAKEFDPTPMINLSGNKFVGVIIQYRLGVFGFLAGSTAIRADGGWNAGIKDARFALKWVQKYIDLFGGDKSRVTIWGQSSGGGTILQLVTQESLQSPPEAEPLWRAAVLSSPWTPPLGGCMDDFFVEQFRNISIAAGCPAEDDDDALSCLRNLPTSALQALNIQLDHALPASHRLNYYTACIEGADDEGAYIKQHVYKSLEEGEVFGEAVLAGSNSADGSGTTPSNLSTSALFTTFLQKNWPLSADEIEELENLYPEDEFGSSHERGTVVYQDAVFSCSATLLVDAFARKGENAWRYLFAVPPATHAEDNAYEFPIWYHTLAPISPTFSASFAGEITSFIQFLDPNIGKPALADNLTWPSIDLRAGSAASNLSLGMTKVFNITPSTNVSAVRLQSLDDPLSGSLERCNFWEKIRIQGGW